MPDPILKITGLEKSFGALKATNGVTLDLYPREIHALIGPNGAGKSTLIKQIVGEIRQDAGTIAFEGQPIDQLDAADRARIGLARTFQVSSIAPEMSALKNVMLAVEARERRIFRFFRPVSRDLGLTEAAMAFLYDAGLGERATIRAADLSHGERRQLEFAIALAMRPKVFLMDEPMAGLSPDGSRRMTAFLSELRHKAPILLIEHDMEAVFALADRISVLVYGQVIATGTVAEIRANPEVRTAYLGDEGSMTTLLKLDGVTAFYGASQALFGIDLDVAEGEVVALMGRNGMGKTTTVRTISALLRPRDGVITFAGQPTRGMAIHRVARLGIGLVPEGRRCFAPLTVEENLTAAARPGGWTQGRVEALFPRLAERRSQKSSTLSGGEQQMLAIGRALMTNPRLLVLDEATEGLAPVVRQEIWAAIYALKGELAILVIDKTLKELRRVADRCFLIERGRTVWTGTPDALTPDLTDRYLGV